MTPEPLPPALLTAATCVGFATPMAEADLTMLSREADAADAFHRHLKAAAIAYAKAHPGHSPMLRRQRHPARTPLQNLTLSALWGAERIAEKMAHLAWWRYENARTYFNDCC